MIGFVAMFALLALFNPYGNYTSSRPPHPPVPVVSSVNITTEASGWLLTFSGAFSSSGVGGTVTISDVQLNGVSVTADVSPNLPLTLNITDKFSFTVSVGQGGSLVSGQNAVLSILLTNGNVGQKTISLP